MSKNWSQWISLSDMMTWLMLVFLLISVLVISEIQEKDKSKNKILIEYFNTRDDLYKDLKESFKGNEEEWWMTISNDLSVKFGNPDILFKPNSKNLTQWFKDILDQFLPKYISIINNNKYDWKIKEIRIEGHAWNCSDSEYMYCLDLSQWRSNSVLEYWFKNWTYKNLSFEDQDKMRFLITSNWMSNWKNLDSYWEYTFFSKNSVDAKRSRRVEFRIISNSENLINELSGDLNIK